MTFLCVSGEEYMKHGSKSHTSVITEQIMKFYLNLSVDVSSAF